jgi:hypothetical protein
VTQSAGFPRLQNEAAVRVLCADLAGPERVLDSLRGMRVEIERVLADIAAMDERTEPATPARTLGAQQLVRPRWCELQLA